MVDPTRRMVDPEISPETAAFWALASDGHLSIGYCRSCSKTHYYPRARCPFCLGAEVCLETVSGKGIIYSYSVMRASPHYVVAYVTLAEGPTILTNIVGADHDAIKIGGAVSLLFQPSEGGQAIPVFQLAADNTRQGRK